MTKKPISDRTIFACLLPSERTIGGPVTREGI